MKTIVVSYDEEYGLANVIDTETCDFISFQWDEDYSIVQEHQDTDDEDFNDNSRWLVKTLLEILKLEKNDSLAHCDWSADYEHNKETGRYVFDVSIKKVEGK